MSACKLSPRLQQYVLYCILRARSRDAALAITTLRGIEGVKEFTNCLGHFGSTAGMFPVAGCSELAQAFCRLCAVYGGVYALRVGVQSIESTPDAPRRLRLILSEGDVVTCDRVVHGADAIEPPPAASAPQPVRSVTYRAVVITDKQLDGDLSAGIAFMVLPPTDARAAAVFAIQLDSVTECAPAGYCASFCVVNVLLIALCM